MEGAEITYSSDKPEVATVDASYEQTVTFTANKTKSLKKITVKYIAKESVTPTTNGYQIWML